jgi:polyketide biosynthesis 3-hydroxy-3-methylglutaryl-CoA synthase-like enzyme PksG
MSIGIEAINAYVGRASLDVRVLFGARGLAMERFDNLFMERKSVNLPCEDPVTNGVNAAKPLIEALTPAERDRIELVVVGTESGIDFGKPISTYIQHHLGLGRRCRSFEVKHACYGGTAALQAAAGLVAASPEADAKALVIATDAASAAARDSYWEPSQGAGAVAMIVSRRPAILELDPGASGFYSHEVMDTLRPRPDLEAGDSDLSVLSYLECLEQAFLGYTARVDGADVLTSFSHLVLHTPFAGMVRGAHRNLMRKLRRMTQAEIDVDFEARVLPSLAYCREVGNIYSAALYLALCSLLDHAPITSAERIGMFSYGSGCGSEFYSGVLTPGSARRLRARGIGAAIEGRYRLSMDEYEQVSDLSVHRMSGVQDYFYDVGSYEAVYKTQFAGRGLLVLDRVENFHRCYRWS